jgi:phage terminase Nu1 subunit (DNA packaging protein)
MYWTTHAVPPTSAGVEHIFSQSGRVVRQDRGRLEDITIAKSMFMKDWLAQHDKQVALEEERDEESEMTAEEEEVQESLKGRFFPENARSKYLPETHVEEDDEDLYN